MGMFDKDKWETNELCFKIDLPCPKCREELVMGYYYLNPVGRTHQHTRYVCLSWPADGINITEPCGWTGWKVNTRKSKPKVEENGVRSLRS